MTTISTLNWTKATETVLRASSILIVTHVSPDGDAIGSLLGLTNALREHAALRAHELSVTAAVDDPVPEFLRYLPGAETIVHNVEGSWDVMISVDASDDERTGKTGIYGRANSKSVINLDHHITNTMFGDIHLVDPQAVSATEIVFDWLTFIGVQMQKQVALPLLTGLVTDTLGFRTSNVNRRTLEVAQAMMVDGVDLREVTARSLDNHSYATLTVWKHAFHSINLDGGVIWATITLDDLRRAGSLDVYTGSLSSFLAKTNEAKISVVFKETPEGKIELSMRSKLGFDVGAPALALGGGGHMQASGATIDGPLEEARKRVIPLLKQAVKEGKAAFE